MNARDVKMHVYEPIPDDLATLSASSLRECHTPERVTAGGQPPDNYGGQP